MNWSATLKEYRKAFHISQERLAKEIGTCQAAVAHWELGRSKPSGCAQRVLRMLPDWMKWEDKNRKEK